MPRRIAEERRAGIVAAVAETLDREGLPFPSYDRVAGHAALSRQLVRHYFPDPEALMVAACQSLAETWLTELSQRLAGLPAGEGLDRLIGLCLDAPEPQADLPPPGAFESMLALARTSAPLRDALQAQVQALNALFSREAELAHPGLNAAQAQELGRLLVSQVLGHWALAGTLAGVADARAARAAMAGIIAAYTGG